MQLTHNSYSNDFLKNGVGYYVNLQSDDISHYSVIKTKIAPFRMGLDISVPNHPTAPWSAGIEEILMMILGPCTWPVYFTMDNISQFCSLEELEKMEKNLDCTFRIYGSDKPKETHSSLDLQSLYNRLNRDKYAAKKRKNTSNP